MTLVTIGLTRTPEDDLYEAAVSAGLMPTNELLLDNDWFAKTVESIHATAENEHMAAAQVQCLTWQREQAQLAVVEGQVAGLRRSEALKLAPLHLRHLASRSAWRAAVKLSRRPAVCVVKASRASSPRPRERRGGSAKNATRGGPDDGESEPAPRHYRCVCCGASLAGRKRGTKFCTAGCKRDYHRGTGFERDPYSEFGTTEDGKDVRDVLTFHAGPCRCDHPIFDPEWGDCVLCGHGRAGDRVAAVRAYVGSSWPSGAIPEPPKQAKHLRTRVKVPA